MVDTASRVKKAEQAVKARYPLPQEVALAGALPHGRRIAKGCAALGIAIRAVFDGNPDLHGTTVEGIEVLPMEAVHSLPSSVPVILCTQRFLAIEEQLSGISSPLIPFSVLSLHDPVAFPPHPFFDGLQNNLLHHWEALRQVRQLLASSHSQDAFDAVMAFRMTFDPQVLRGVVVDHEYLAPDVLTLSSQEVVVDGGSYTGDTIESLLQQTGGARRVVAFEPDPTNFEKLQQAYGDNSTVICRQEGLYSCSTELRFASNGREDAALSLEGESSISVVVLDQIPEVQDVTFLRLNIEGAEMEALAGARELLLRQRPKIAVAVYHVPEHLWRIPLWLAALLPNYEFHLRQHEGGLVETVLYAIPREAL
jgi:FkbM family methyltransferase